MDNANPSAGFQFVLLSTDLLVWLLLLTALGALWWVRRQPLVRAGWAQVGQRPGAMAAACASQVGNQNDFTSRFIW